MCRIEQRAIQVGGKQKLFHDGSSFQNRIQIHCIRSCPSQSRLQETDTSGHLTVVYNWDTCIILQ